MALSREAFLASLTLARKEVPLADGSSVHVREMTGSEVAEFIRLQKKDGDVITFTILATLCDENGVKLLTPDDAPAVAAMGAVKSNAILTAALELSGLTDSKKD
jgi:hypothetical protein